MPNMPVNHHLQPMYRVLAAACGLYILVFGLAATVMTGGHGLFAREGLPQVLGLRANRAFALMSIVAGLVIVVGAVIGRNADRWINLLGGIGFLVAGFFMMTLLRTSLNVLGFTMTTCIVSFIIGTILLTAGLYGKTGTAAEVHRMEAYRHDERVR